MKFLELKNITFSYKDKKIFENFSMNVEKGEIVMLKGASGIGKSTLLRLISGLEKLENGSIYLDDKNISTISIENRKIAYLFQDYALFPHMTVKQNILYPISKLNKFEKMKKLEELLNLVKLKELSNRYPNSLSGGEKQRVALARSIANQPKLLLLDEPFSSLDEELKDKLREDIKNIIKSINITAIMVSHDSKDAIIADRVIKI